MTLALYSLNQAVWHKAHGSRKLQVQAIMFC